MFLVLFSVLFGSFVLIRGGGPQGFLEKYTNQSHITITPLVMGESEAIPLLFLCASALIMGVANCEYGLPLRKALGKDFWVGSFYGFLAIMRHPADNVPVSRVPHHRPGSARDSNRVFASWVGHRMVRLFLTSSQYFLNFSLTRRKSSSRNGQTK
jgi:hypothetical protein